MTQKAHEGGQNREVLLRLQSVHTVVERCKAIPTKCRMQALGSVKFPSPSLRHKQSATSHLQIGHSTKSTPFKLQDVKKCLASLVTLLTRVTLISLLSSRRRWKLQQRRHFTSRNSSTIYVNGSAHHIIGPRAKTDPCTKPGAKATMSEFQSEDPFSTALTETERLLVVWDDLTIAGVGDSPIAAFVRKSIADLSLPRMHADSIISFQQLARLLGILDSMRSRGTAEASNTACLVIFIAEEIVRMRNAHSVSGFDGTPKSTLQRFKDLEHWVALRTMVENKQLSRFFERRLMNIISFDVNALPIQLNASPDSLRVIEVGAKLLKTLPLQHNAKILQIIDPQMKALTASNDKCKAYHSRTSGAGDDGVVRAVAHTSEKLAAVKDAHVKVRSTIHCTQSYSRR